MTRKIGWINILLIGVLLAGCAQTVEQPSQAIEAEAPLVQAAIVTEAPAAQPLAPVVETPPTDTLPDPTEAPTEAPAGAPAAEVYGALALDHLQALAEMGARWPGSEEETQAGDYIARVFEAAGYAVEVQDFTFTNEDDEEVESRNILAVKPGESERRIVIGAHYDSSDEADGVDDNASGAAVLLEIAALAAGLDTPYTLVFAAFGAEENDMDGSRHFVDQLSRSEQADLVGMINLDSLAAGDLAYAYGTTESGGMLELAAVFAQAEGLDLTTLPDSELRNADGSACECADYGPFEAAGVPFLYFEATNWKLGEKDGMTQVDPGLGEAGAIRHTTYDTLDYLQTTFPGRIEAHLDLFVRLVLKVLSGLS